MTQALDSGFRRNDEGRSCPTEPSTVILKESAFGGRLKSLAQDKHGEGFKAPIFTKR